LEFGQTEEAPAPAPGGAAVTTSPELGNASAVEANVKGFSPHDLVFIAALAAGFNQKLQERCFLVATQNVIGAIRFKQAATQGFTQESEIEKVSEELAGAVFGQAAACIVAAQREIASKGLLSSLARGASATPCASKSLTFISRRSHGKTRLQRAYVGGATDLSVRCTISGGALKLRIASKSRKPLRKSLGSRLRLGIARSGLDPAGGRLGFSYHKG
jgi:hypothetical protein